MFIEIVRPLVKKITTSALILATITISNISGASEKTPVQCAELPEKQIVDAILNQQYAQARNLVDTLNLSNALIPSPDFYQGLAIWHQGYQRDNVKLKKKGIASLRIAIREMQSRLSSTPSRTSSLALGLSKGHTARALLENAQYISGYEMGMQAKQHLNRFRSLSNKSELGFDDSGLLLGLYEVYTHDLLEQNQWLKENIANRGDRNKGISLIENAVNGRSIFSSEAMRALLADISWRTPETCKYVDAMDTFGQKFSGNKDFVTLRQGLLLKCGHTDRAKYANEHHAMQSDPSTGLREILVKARLRILADLGDFKSLYQFSVPTGLEMQKRLAYANALDIAGERDRAYEEYKFLSSSTETPVAVRSVAQVRLHYPYHRPKKIEVPQFKITSMKKKGC